jgi:hypothetical protein
MHATERQNALYAERCSPATPGVKLPFTPEDLVTQLYRAASLATPDSELAVSWGVPVEFVRAFRAAGDEA